MDFRQRSCEKNVARFCGDCFILFILTLLIHLIKTLTLTFSTRNNIINLGCKSSIIHQKRGYALYISYDLLDTRDIGHPKLFKVFMTKNILSQYLTNIFLSVFHHYFILSLTNLQFFQIIILFFFNKVLFMMIRKQITFGQ